jgi:hypothetical protein
MEKLTVTKPSLPVALTSPPLVELTTDTVSVVVDGERFNIPKGYELALVPDAELGRLLPGDFGLAAVPKSDLTWIAAPLGRPLALPEGAPSDGFRLPFLSPVG